jgi:hypothetical protein
VQRFLDRERLSFTELSLKFRQRFSERVFDFGQRFSVRLRSRIPYEFLAFQSLMDLAIGRVPYVNYLDLGASDLGSRSVMEFTYLRFPM